MSSSQPLFSLGELFGEIRDSPRFELQELLGHGAYSVVWLVFVVVEPIFLILAVLHSIMKLKRKCVSKR